MTYSSSHVAETSVHWLPCYRIIPSRFPPVDLLERVTSPEEFEIIYEIEQRTNPRIRDEMGDVELVLRSERLVGPGSSHIMAAFTHLPLYGSRFTDGSYGVYYAANTLDTAIAETKYHREKFLRDCQSPPIEIDMRVLLSDLNAILHTLLGLQKRWPDIYDPTDYTASQQLGRALRADGLASFGLLYNSVRHATGHCVAVFRPKALSRCRQEKHLCYIWDGTKISKVYRKSAVSNLS